MRDMNRRLEDMIELSVANAALVVQQLDPESIDHRAAVGRSLALQTEMMAGGETEEESLQIAIECLYLFALACRVDFTKPTERALDAVVKWAKEAEKK